MNELEISKGTIKFDNVNFNYNSDSKSVLKGIDKYLGGEMTSLRHSGAGKSTILNLIPRFMILPKVI